jgi:hypothetical protein
VKSVVRQLKSELTALISPAHVAHGAPAYVQGKGRCLRCAECTPLHSVIEVMSAQPAIVEGRDQHHNSLLHLASKVCSSFISFAGHGM